MANRIGDHIVDFIKLTAFLFAVPLLPVTWWAIWWVVTWLGF